jgi:hypothetical protein
MLEVSNRGNEGATNLELKQFLQGAGGDINTPYPTDVLAHLYCLGDLLFGCTCFHRLLGQCFDSFDHFLRCIRREEEANPLQ